MAARAPSSRLETWERREQPLMALVPWIALALSAIPVAVLDSHSARTLTLGTGLAVLAALWMLWFFTLHPPGWRERPRMPALAMAGLLVLMAVMVLHNPVYGIYTWTGYIFVYRAAQGPWRLLATFVVAVIGATSQDGGLPRSPAQGAFYAILLLFNVGIALAFTWFASVSYEQGERRKQLVAELSEANRRLEAALAENAGLHEQLLTQAREAGIMDERQRMAREIHDTLAQGLTGIITQLQAAAQGGRPADRDRRIEAAIRLARDSLSEARRSVHELRPELLETARLGEALAEVAQRWSALHGVPARVTTTGVLRPMPADVEVTLLRTAQEALANVAKHANATRVGLTLSYMEDEVALDVRDDGIGFVPAGLPLSADGGGFGLTAMRQRVERLSGTLEIESESGVGTAISACVPAPLVEELSQGRT
ncbi:MAG TPA: sensor histidine kinase [Streptosporangiaceae bacterium]